MIMKHTGLLIVISLSLYLLPACGADEGGINLGQAPATPAETPTPLPTPVQEYQSTISADGDVVLPLPPQTFNFPSSSSFSGTVREVYVVVGQHVKQGDIVARVDDTDLQNAVAQAEASLDLLKAQIANEQAAPLAGDIREARASLISAQAELVYLESLPSDEAITQAAADLKLREVELRQAQEAYDEVAYAEGIGMSPQAAELQRATLNYERAQAVYEEATKPATPAQLATARLSVIQAENQLEKLLAEERPEVTAVNEARIREAQLQVDEARANLVKAELIAPWDGVVTAINAAPGVPASSASFTLVQAEPLRFATRNFSERNLADIKPGDKATIFLKAYPNVPIPAILYRIELESNQKDGDTALFTVYFDFNSGDLSVQPGMTGRVEIVLDQES